MVVVWTQRALNAVRVQYRWYVENSGISAAEKFRLGIFADASLLEQNPKLGVVEDTINEMYGEPKWRSLTSGKKYKIIYSIDNQTVKIAAVWGCRRDIKILGKIIKKK